MKEHGVYVAMRADDMLSSGRLEEFEAWMAILRRIDEPRARLPHDTVQ